MATSYKVIAAAAFVRRERGHSELIYRGAPVPADATNAEELLEGGFIGEMADGEVAGGHPSDVPDENTPATRAARDKAKADADAKPAPPAATAATPAAAPTK